MEIGKIVSMAQEKLGNTNLSERTLQTYFTAHKPDGEPDDAYFDKHVEVLKSLGGQYSHDVAAWKAQWEKEHGGAGNGGNGDAGNGGRGSQGAGSGNGGTGDGGGMSADVKDLLDSYKQQLDEVKGMLKQQQAMASEGVMRNMALEYGKNSKAAYIDLWNDVVGRTAISDGMTQEQFNASVKATYEKNVQFFGEGVQGYGASGAGDTSAAMKKELDDYFASKGM